MCVCTEACTEEAVNHDCPVCGAEGAQACACEEVIAVDDADDAPSDADDADARKLQMLRMTSRKYILSKPQQRGHWQ